MQECSVELTECEYARMKLGKKSKQVADDDKNAGSLPSLVGHKNDGFTDMNRNVH